jgi:redox-sensitive bicupin YhaK (pirin superfamily)
VNVIAGKLNDVKGSASTFTEINVFDIRLNKNGEMIADIPSSHNTAMLVIEGDAGVNGQHSGLHNFVLFKNEGETITIKANEKSLLLLLSGEPINEPIAQYGPFVMNTQQEIQESFREFESGKFGVLN